MKGLLPTLIVVLVSLKADAESQMTAHLSKTGNGNNTFRVARPDQLEGEDMYSCQSPGGGLSTPPGSVTTQWVEMDISDNKTEAIV